MEIFDKKDRPAWVRFEVVEKEDKQKSIAAGYYVGKDVDYALVTPPGTKDVFKQEVQTWLKQLRVDASAGRISEAWVDQYADAYKRWKAGQEIPVNGTPLKGWLRISPAQQKACLEMGVGTIEDLAALNDEGLRRLGMGALQLKQTAVAELAAAKDIGPVVKRNAELEQEVSVLKGSLENLQAQVSVLMAQSKPEATSDAIAASEILDDDPVAAYVKKFGKAPHHRMKHESIVAALKE